VRPGGATRGKWRILDGRVESGLMSDLELQGCDRTTSEMRGWSPKIISGILDEARIHKHTHISIQYQI
jgi:hypothetical protein